MKGNFNGWIMPVNPQPLYFSFGSITKKSGVIGDNVAPTLKNSVDEML